MGHKIKSVSGVNISVEDIGTGRPIVFIHGWPVNHKMFEYQFTELPKHGYRCVGIDLRGFGDSDKPFFDHFRWNFGDMYAALYFRSCAMNCAATKIYDGHPMLSIYFVTSLHGLHDEPCFFCHLSGIACRPRGAELLLYAVRPGKSGDSLKAHRLFGIHPLALPNTKTGTLMDSRAC